MEYSTVNKLVGGQQETCGICLTIEALNDSGNASPILSTEELEELESRGINPYWNKQIFQKGLKEHALKNGVWLDKSYLNDKALLHDQKKEGTSENDVYSNADNKTLTKINNLSYVKGSEHQNNLNALIDRLAAHNYLFPDVAYTIKGFIENKNGVPALVLEQPYVKDVERNATQEEIKQYLTDRGFKLDGIRSWSNEHQVWSNGKFELFDARPANVLKGIDGQLYFIDTFPHSIEYMNQLNTSEDVVPVTTNLV